MGIVTDFDYNCPKCDEGLEHVGNGIWKCMSCNYKENTDIKPCANHQCENLIHTYDDFTFCWECRE